MPADINLATGKPRREDWQHRIDVERSRQARRIRNSRSSADHEVEEIKKPDIGPVHPLRFPPTQEATQVDWQQQRQYLNGPQARVRLVGEADIDEILDRGLPKFLDRYPRARPDTLLPFLKLACRERRFRFLRTDLASALFVVEQTPWEPEPVVFDIFMVTFETTARSAVDVLRLYESGYIWARDIKAVEFKFGSTTGIDLRPIAARIGYDFREYGFARKIIIETPEREAKRLDFASGT